MKQVIKSFFEAILSFCNYGFIGAGLTFGAVCALGTMAAIGKMGFQ